MNTDQKLRQWQEAGLMDSETAERILAFEKRQPTPRKLPLLLIVGLIFFSLAVFSFIAANWQAIPDLAKVLLMLGLMWLFYSIAHFSQKKAVGHPLLFRVIGLAMFGATLLTAAQTFHFPLANSLLPWAMFLASLAHYFYWRNLIYSVIAFLFGGAVLISFLPDIGWTEWGIFVIITAAWFYFSKSFAPVAFSWILLFASGFMLWGLVDYDSSLWPIWTLFALVLLLLIVPENKQRTIRPLYLIAAGMLLVVYLAVRGQTFISIIDESHMAEAIALAFAGIGIFALSFFKFRSITWVAVPGAIGLLLYEETAIGLAVVAELAGLAYLILAQRQNEPLGLGFVYFIIVQFVIYIIYAWERLDMSLFFLIGALLLFLLSAMAWWINRRKEGAKL
ncbi:DUF2157 domain-containing protein [Planococcus sp. CPCC 101016]|uniref:DUF2157 domain-containing protein n=1 Tax=Planococcus sp. CPCC 101016 TaxID=2599617 RepID=UPI0011B4587A|nr:DUF2157 domain-containing protein [Planococcus sp. CPCC 101016]TWT07136.1 DUF2157 domain-containing protein [Planococcus sp. CPCC 101016]